MNDSNSSVDHAAAQRTAEELTPDEVRNARLAIAELIFDRVPDLPAALTKKRRELALHLGCSEGTLNSITAYVRYWATQAIEDANAGALARDDVVAAWYYLEHSAPPSETNEWNGLDEIFDYIGGAEKGADAEQLKRAVEAYRRRLATSIVRRTKATARKEKTAAAPQESESPEPVQPAAEPVAEKFDAVPVAASVEAKSPTITGATFNYDNPEKTDWRDDIVMRYACETIPESERPTAKIVCFGGRKNLEPQAYIARTFTPGNITSVECDEGVAPEFLASANAAGIRTYLGKLSDMRSRERFRLASLDYTGPVTLDRMHDAWTLLLEDDATVIINCQQKRDPKLMRVAAMLQMHVIDKVRDISIASKAVLPSGYSANTDLTNIFEEAPDTQLTPEEWARSRRKFIVAALSSFGLGRRESVSMQGFPHLERLFLFPIDDLQRVGDTPPEDEMGALIGRFGDEYCAAYGRLTKVPPPALLRNLAFSMVMGTRMAFTSRPLISNLQFEKYYSEHDGTRNPFLTACARLRVPRELYKKHRTTFHGLAQIMEAMLQDKEKHGRLRMEPATVRGRGLASVFTKQTVQLAFRTQQGNVGNIDIQELQETFDELRALQQEHVCYALDDDQEDIDANGLGKRDSLDAVMAEHAEKVKTKALRTMNKMRQPKFRRY